VRVELREWIRRLHDEVHVTSIFVTHDQEEALEISDLLVVLNKGKVEQVGSPQEVYEQPATSFVMSFIGPVNRIEGDAIAGLRGGGAGSSAALVRPSEISIRKNGHDIHDGASGRIDRVRHLGPLIKLEIVLPDAQRMQVHLSRDQFKELQLQRGDWVSLEAKQPRVFHEDYSI
jgi:sulfate transport system ATP-binding protein